MIQHRRGNRTNPYKGHRTKVAHEDTIKSLEHLALAVSRIKFIKNEMEHKIKH